MVQKIITCERFAWELLPNKKSGSKVLAGKREGKNLANSVTEDISGWALFSNSPTSPSYSAKQLRSMKRRAMAR